MKHLFFILATGVLLSSCTSTVRHQVASYSNTLSLVSPATATSKLNLVVTTEPTDNSHGAINPRNVGIGDVVITQPILIIPIVGNEGEPSDKD